MTTAVDEREETRVRLADGVELLGAFEGSGCQEPPHLLRRRDGQVIQVSRLLYLVASSIDDHGELDRVAERVSREFGQELSPENVSYLIDNKLRPTGVVTSGETTEPPLQRANPLLALRLRVGLVPERAHRAVTTALQTLFWPPIIWAALAGLIALDAWLFLAHGGNVLDGAHQVIYQPRLLLLLSALSIASLAFHELGHAAAARYGGATPGTLGAGIYLVWPVFYTDVTDSYRLDRRGRLRTDLGGVYFNVLFVLGAAAAYLATGFQPLAVFLLLSQLETLQQFLPLLRLDGYYVVSDLVGVPNLFAYMGPVLARLTRQGGPQIRRQAQAKLANLKPWARRLITAWVCLTLPILLINVAFLAVFGPRIAGTAWASAQNQLHEIAAAHAHSDTAGVLNGIISLLLLAMPAAGTLYIVARLTRRLGQGARRCGHVHPLPTALAATLLGAVLALHLTLAGPDAFTAARKQVELAHSKQVELAHNSQPASQQVNSAVTPTPPADTSSSAGATSPAGRPEPATPPPTMAPPAANITLPGAPMTALTPALSPLPADETAPAATWTVLAGDDLWSIAQQVQAQALGRAATDDETSPYWAQLLDANRAALDGPDLLYAGQVLTIPAPATARAAPTTTQTAEPATASPPPTAHQPPADETGVPAAWTVRPGDDLWSIAQQVQAQALGRAPANDETSTYWVQLLDANRATVATPDLLYTGQVLTVPTPLSASREVRPR
jgi:nucleoid-associated protein YgaU